MEVEAVNEIGSQRTLDAMTVLMNVKDDYVRPFVENIDSVNRLYNRPMEMLFDQENVYLAIA